MRPRFTFRSPLSLTLAGALVSAWFVACGSSSTPPSDASTEAGQAKPADPGSSPDAALPAPVAAPADESPTTSLASPVSGPARDEPPPPPPRAVEQAPLDLTSISEVPQLVVDGLGHTSKVRSLLYTHDGRSLVSAGYDKTVRVWSASTGELQRTLRGEIGAGPAGRIYTTALSADDQFLAVAGWLGQKDQPSRSSGEAAFQVRVLDFYSGSTLRLLSGHSDVVMSSAFSHQGHRLLTGAGDQTAALWDARSGQRLTTLSGHSGGVTAVAFSPDDRLLATGSIDRTARVFDSNGSLRFSISGHTDTVTAVAFTPSGRSLLTASADGSVRIHDANTGSQLKLLAQVGVPISSLGITPDGLHVLVTTSGGAFATEVFHINTGKRVAVNQSHDNVVLTSAISPNGKWAATAGGSDFTLAVWELGTGKEEVHTSGHGAPVWNVAFRRDSSSIAWSHEISDEVHSQKQLSGPVRLELPLTGERVPLSVVETSNQTDFVRAVERVGTVEARTPSGEEDEELLVYQNGQRRAAIRRDLTSGFIHRAFSLTPDGQTVISGGDNGALTSYSTSSGYEQKKFIGHTGDVLSVAISPDGKRLVSGASDQTVRLWDVASGELLLTVFRARNREWVAFTPSGYYASSPYGDGYVGWHANRGAEQPAAFIPASALAAQLRYDAVVRYFILGGGIAAAIRSCNDGLLPGQPPVVYYRFEDLPQFAPPRVYYLDPGADLRIASDRIEITAKAHSPSLEAVTDMQFLVNGRPIDEKWKRAVGYPRLSKVGREATLRAIVPLPEKVNRISVVASNRFNTSEPIGFDVHRTGGKAELEKIYQPDLYLLSVGVSRYGSPWLTPLAYADEDAQAIAQAFEKQNKQRYAKVNIRTLTERSVTRTALMNELRYLGSGAEQGDVVVLFLSGYAAVDSKGDYYFLPHDGDPARLAETAISWMEIRAALEKLPARVVLLLDSSHGGAVTGTERVTPIDISALLRKSVTPEGGLVLLTSSTGSESSFESAKWKHGAFTMALLEGLGGKADYDGDRQVWIRELEHYVTKRVPTLTERRQHPTTEIPSSMPNFALTDR